MQRTEPFFGDGRRAAMLTTLRTLPAVVLIAVLAACSGSASNDSPPSTLLPSDAPSSPGDTPDFGEIEHPTGPTDVVLRFEEGGGFVMPAGVAVNRCVGT